MACNCIRCKRNFNIVDVITELINAGKYDLSGIKPGMKVKLTIDDINNETSITHNWGNLYDQKKSMVGYEYTVDKISNIFVYLGGIPFFIGAIKDLGLEDLRKDIAEIATTGQFMHLMDIRDNEKLVIVIFHASGLSLVGYMNYPPAQKAEYMRFGRTIIKWGTDAHLSQLAEYGPREETELGHQISQLVNTEGIGVTYLCDEAAWVNKLFS